MTDVYTTLIGAYDYTDSICNAVMIDGGDWDLPLSIGFNQESDKVYVLLGGSTQGVFIHMLNFNHFTLEMSLNTSMSSNINNGMNFYSLAWKDGMLFLNTPFTKPDTSTYVAFTKTYANLEDANNIILGLSIDSTYDYSIIPESDITQVDGPWGAEASMLYPGQVLPLSSPVSDPTVTPVNQHEETWYAQTCGDGIIEGIENCEDGNTNNNDGCDELCVAEPGWTIVNDLSDPSNHTSTKTPICGDGILLTVEECDDDNEVSWDGCSDTCLKEEGWTYELVANGEHDMTIATEICGDNIVVGDDICDGLNCNEQCTDALPGWTCSGGNRTEPTVCESTCGDEYIVGSEQCDDGNQSIHDGCDASCVPEPGWTLTNVTNQYGDGLITTAENICGDGLKVTGEVCDNQGKVLGDGVKCLDDCSGSHLGWTCTGGSPSTPSFCQTTCGDGILVGDEACDDGNTDPWDGCDSSCVPEDGWIMHTVPNPDIAGAQMTDPVSICGDGKLVQGEVCDNEGKVLGDEVKCLDNCQGSYPGWTCSGGSPTSPSVCTSECGDGVLVQGEDCDDSNLVPWDGCDDQCQKETGWTHINEINVETSFLWTVSTPICGDSIVVSAENCDEGPDSVGSGVGCADDCLSAEYGYDCSGGSLTSPSTCIEVCGNNLISVSEQCEDGNTEDWDGCSSTCQFEEGWTHETLIVDGLEWTTPTPICGDKIVVGSDVCDDGFQFCLPGCEEALEGFDCAPLGPPPTITRCGVQCGDGKIAVTEDCEDGNQVSGDGCSKNCL